MNRLESAQIGENDVIEAVIRIDNKAKTPDTHENIQELIKNGEIRHPSIYARPVCGIHREGNRVVPTCGYEFQRVALLRKSKMLPGDPLSKIWPLPLTEGMRTKLIESIQSDAIMKKVSQTQNHGDVTSNLDLLDKTELGDSNKIPEKEEKKKMTEETKVEIAEAVWTTAQINDFPDSSFAFISPGGEKDGEGKTTPRGLRHLPYEDASGKVDAAHCANALARLNQVQGLSGDQEARVRAKLQKAMKSVNPDYEPSEAETETVRELELKAEKSKLIADHEQEKLELSKLNTETENRARKAEKERDEANRKIIELQKECERDYTRIAEMQKQLDKTHKDFSKEQAEHSETKAQLKESNEREKQVRDRLSEEKDRRSGLESDLKRTKDKLTESIKTRGEESAERAKADTRARNETQERARIQGENAELVEKNASLTRDISDLSDKRLELSKKLLRLEDERAKVTNRVNELTSQQEQTLTKLNRTRKKLFQLADYLNKEHNEIVEGLENYKD